MSLCHTDTDTHPPTRLAQQSRQRDTDTHPPTRLAQQSCQRDTDTDKHPPHTAKLPEEQRHRHTPSYKTHTAKSLEGHRHTLLQDSHSKDEHEEQSPIYCDQVRAGPKIELKHKPRDDPSHIQLQLRANMNLCLSRKLEKILDQYSLEDLQKLRTMTIYGATFGYRSNHLLLKLTIDFQTRCTFTSVRYTSVNSVPWAVEATVA